MATTKSFQSLSLILLSLLVSQAFVLPVLARAHAEKKLAETGQTIGFQNTVHVQDYRGSLPGPGNPGNPVVPVRPGPGAGMPGGGGPGLVPP